MEMDSIYLMPYLGITTFIYFRVYRLILSKYPHIILLTLPTEESPVSHLMIKILCCHTHLLLQNLPMRAYSHALFQSNIHWPHPSVSYAFLLHTFAHTILKCLLFLPWLSKCVYPLRSKLIPTFSKKVFQTQVMVITFVVKLSLFLSYSLMIIQVS